MLAFSFHSTNKTSLRELSAFLRLRSGDEILTFSFTLDASFLHTNAPLELHSCSRSPQARCHIRCQHERWLSRSSLSVSSEMSCLNLIMTERPLSLRCSYLLWLGQYGAHCSSLGRLSSSSTLAMGSHSLFCLSLHWPLDLNIVSSSRLR
jgi:hypothetical protein